jgi:RsiW-degrading membrane proteinase PrsW (M82 family)
LPDPTTVLAAAVLALVPSLIYLIVLNAIDRYEKEPWSILLSCVGAGAIIAPAVSVAIFALAGRGAVLPPAFAPGLNPDALTGIVEELVIGVLLIVIVKTVRTEFDDVLDGVIYGAAIGAGFGAAESFLYALGGLDLLTRGTIAQLVIAGLNHAFYAAAIGAAIGVAQGYKGAARWYIVALGVATASLLHTLHDTLPAIMAHVLGQPSAAVGAASRLLANAVNWLGLIAILVIVVWAWRHEARILRAELHNEVKDGVVSEIDYATITTFGARTRRGWQEFRRGGWAAASRLNRRYAAEGELAFHKWHRTVRDQRAPDPAEDEALRAEIRSLAETAPEGAR